MGLEEKKQVPFRGTAEQERQLLDFIEEHKQYRAVCDTCGSYRA